jgi:RHS repeat-associated protein
VQGVYSSAGAIQELATYSPYGVQTISIGTRVTPFGFQGSYTDTTGLIYVVSRYYDPTTDQFLSVDPMVDSTNQPYVFVNDNPLNACDPLGNYQTPVQQFSSGLIITINLPTYVLPFGSGTFTVSTTVIVEPTQKSYSPIQFDQNGNVSVAGKGGVSLTASPDGTVSGSAETSSSSGVCASSSGLCTWTSATYQVNSTTVIVSSTVTYKPGPPPTNGPQANPDVVVVGIVIYGVSKLACALLPPPINIACAMA